jgi:hypothetical protein
MHGQRGSYAKVLRTGDAASPQAVQWQGISRAAPAYSNAAGRACGGTIRFPIRHFPDMFTRQDTIAGFDPELDHAIRAEVARQEDHIELIASENYASPRVLEAQGSVLTNKYAEGYPGKRYYGGCEHVDVVEQLAIDRCRQLFGAEYANVQPHSGSQANQAVYTAVLKPGDTLLGMSLAHGGHLTHGGPPLPRGRLRHDRRRSHRLRRGGTSGSAAPPAHDRRRRLRLRPAHRFSSLP